MRPQREQREERKMTRRRAGLAPNLSKNKPIGPASIPIPGNITPNNVLYLHLNQNNIKKRRKKKPKKDEKT